jgi:putative ABC transport system substrate-binding protein
LPARISSSIEVLSAHPLGADGLPDVKQLAPMLDRMAALKPDLVYIPPVNFFGPHSDYLMQEALARKLPTFCAIEVQVKSGGLMGLVVPFYNVGALAGYKAEQILLGKMAVQKTPIEVLSRFSYMVNMPTARALGLYPPMQILRFAQIIGA